jgi:hypothetical protein
MAKARLETGRLGCRCRFGEISKSESSKSERG